MMTKGPWTEVMEHYVRHRDIEHVFIDNDGDMMIVAFQLDGRVWVETFRSGEDWQTHAAGHLADPDREVRLHTDRTDPCSYVTVSVQIEGDMPVRRVKVTR